MSKYFKRHLIKMLSSFILISSIVTGNISANKNIALTHNDVVVDDVSFSKGDKYKLSISDDSYLGYQWQIFNKYDANKKWININGQNASEIELSYAMLKTQLDKDNSTKIRLRTTDSKSAINYSQEIKVTVKNNKNIFNPNKAPQKINKKSNSDNFSIDDKYVSVVIDYEYEKGGTAFDSYTAIIIKNMTFTTTVASPNILGYKPFVKDENGNYTEADVINIDYKDGISESTTIKVIYRPALVDYRVRYHFQNIKDDLYSEKTAESILDKGYTDSLPDKNYFNKTYQGYSVLSNDIDYIAADGSSIYDVFYNRNYYLMNFNLDGGYGVEPIYAKFDDSFIVNNPTKYGYVFKGWDTLDENGNGDGIIDVLPTRIPASNKTYKAIWEAQDTTYTVVYWKENPNDTDYSYWGKNVISAKSSDTVSGIDDVRNHDFSKSVVQEAVPAKNGFSAIREYYEYEFFHFDHADTNVTVDGDGSTVVNVYYKRNVYEMRFYYARQSKNWIGRTVYNVATSTIQGSVEGSTWTQVNGLPTFVDNSKQSHTEVINGDTYYYYSFSGKYEEDIANLFPSNLCNPIGATLRTYTLINWGPNDGCKYRTEYGNNASILGSYSSLTADIILDPANPIGNKFVAWWSGSNTVRNQTYRIYYELLPEETPNADSKEYNGKYYNLNDTLVFPADYNGVTRFDAIEFAGMKSLNGYGVDDLESHDFYYDRDRYQLTYFNYNTSSATPDKEEVLYGEPIKNYEIKDMSNYYPDSLEEDAYIFNGWSLDPNGVVPVDWENDTVSGNLNVYSDWNPVEHDVSVYKTHDDAISQSNEYAHFKVPHGNTVNPDISFKEPDREGYTFLGWFFINNGEKVAFNFNEMIVNKNISVFAEWSSDIVVNYTINYVYKNADGTVIKIGDQVKGSTFAGTTKTFKAKYGNELYDGYKSHYYPTSNSHSIVMDVDSDNNVYTFEYVYLEKVPYTVRYIDKITGKQLAPDKVVNDNEANIVTEQFQYIKGYAPDAFYKKLILSGNKDENIITFYYIPDMQHAYYAAHYYVQNLEDDNYTEYIVTEGVGDVGTEITADIFDVAGFKYNSAKSKSSGTITETGLKLEIYYDRQSYNYTINYLEYGSDKVLVQSNTGNASYGKTISATAIDISGYNLVNNAEKSITITNNDDLNVINFYYKPIEVTIYYKTVVDGNDDNGEYAVSLSQEIVNSVDMIVGATPITAGTTHEFEGWYSDEECTMRVDSKYISETNKLTPEFKSATYYARFIQKKGALKISVNGADTGADPNQSFVFNIKGIKGTNTGGIETTIAIHENGFAVVNNLPMGDYIVTEENKWQFRYKSDSPSKTITIENETDIPEATFKYDRHIAGWFDGSSYKNNIFEMDN